MYVLFDTIQNAWPLEFTVDGFSEASQNFMIILTLTNFTVCHELMSTAKWYFVLPRTLNLTEQSE